LVTVNMMKLIHYDTVCSITLSTSKTGKQIY